MTLHLSQQAVATLVAALRAWQNELNDHTTQELRDYHPELRDVDPLSIEEVEGLLTQLRATHGSSIATVSSVRPSAGGGS